MIRFTFNLGLFWLGYIVGYLVAEDAKPDTDRTA